MLFVCFWASHGWRQYNSPMDISLLLMKLGISILVVLVLSVVAERVSPQAAGIISGYPAGIAINLFFFGYEIGPAFAAESALYTATGLLATLSFVYFYYLASSRITRCSVLFASLVSILGYLAVVWCVHKVPVNWATALFIPIFSLFLFLYLFRRIKNSVIVDKAQLSGRVFLLRAFASAGIITIVTSLAHVVGPAYAGLFAAFPSTMFPLMLIIHLTYDVRHVHTIIKNFPLGLGSLIVYALLVALTYGSLGIFWGTIISFAAATAYLLAYAFLLRRKGSEPRFCICR
ncbi:MAG TPA: hypothetical protein VLH56_03825 [Dissulfurispiraceae bacterium]|nr:hypothetical protein [Dissulfurispiraceae bacterium]